MCFENIYNLIFNITADMRVKKQIKCSMFEIYLMDVYVCVCVCV